MGTEALPLAVGVEQMLGFTNDYTDGLNHPNADGIVEKVSELVSNSTDSLIEQLSIAFAQIFNKFINENKETIIDKIVEKIGQEDLKDKMMSSASSPAAADESLTTPEGLGDATAVAPNTEQTDIEKNAEKNALQIDDSAKTLTTQKLTEQTEDAAKKIAEQTEDAAKKIAEQAAKTATTKAADAIIGKSTGAMMGKAAGLFGTAVREAVKGGKTRRRKSRKTKRRKPKSRRYRL